jgi:FkbM family methyltransferase
MHPLSQFQESPTAQLVQTVWFVGAHKFEERGPIFRTFPNLKHIYLFEPLPGPCEQLRTELAGDARIEVFNYALSDFEGTADFFVSSNVLSSSLLKLGRHAVFFPGISYTKSITARVRTVAGLLHAEKLAGPNLLFMDAQGAELRILQAVPPDVLAGIELVFTEASLEELYVGSGTFADIQRFLGGQYECRGFWPLPFCPCHGDALFVNRKCLSSPGG